MAFDNPTNRGRALKIVDTLDLMEKSARSNGAEPAEIADMCAPVVNRLREIGALPPESVPLASEAEPQPVQDAEPVPVMEPAHGGTTAADLRGLSAGRRASLMLADQASLRELMAALCGRLDAHGERLDQLVDLKRQRDAAQAETPDQ